MKVEKVSCYKEWLPLEKSEFGVLAIIAEQNGFEGNLTDLCRSLSLSPQTQTRHRLKKAIEEITKNGFCECLNSEQKYCIKIIPQETEIRIDPRAIDDLKNHRYSAANVSWEVVLKVYLWSIQHRWDELTTNYQISVDLGGISEKVIGRAKKVLIEDFEVIDRNIERKRRADGEIRTIGHYIIPNAWWNYKGKK